MLSEDDAALRKAAHEALWHMAEPAVPALVAVLEGEDGKPRHEAAAILAAIRPGATLRVLVRLLGHENADIRREAAWALGTIGPRSADAVPDLIAALGDKDPLVVPQAAWALGQIGPRAKDALPALEKLLVEMRHRRIVADAVMRIRGP
jgi:HEAT repeat protein